MVQLPDRWRGPLRVAGPVLLLAGLAAMAWGLTALLDVIPEMPAAGEPAAPVSAELPLGALAGLIGGFLMLALGGSATTAAFKRPDAKTAAAPPAGRSCGACGAAASPSAQFCPGCGAPLPPAVPCRGCGAPLPKAARFCESCGAAAVP